VDARYALWPFDEKEAWKRQDHVASALGVAKEVSLDLGKGVTMKLVLIPPGKFDMGTPPDEERDNPAEWERPHEVTISSPFYLGVYEVSRKQFGKFVAESGYETEVERSGRADVLDPASRRPASKGGSCWREPGFEQDDEHPVVLVTWNDASEFCEWASKKAKRKVSLPLPRYLVWVG